MSIVLDLHIGAKYYAARPVLRDVRLRLQAGEIVSLIGASGCGKSSLLAIAAGLDRDFTGQVLLDGQPLHGVSRAIGVIFQEPRLFPWLTVAQNVAFGSGGDTPGDDAQGVTRLLEEVGLGQYGAALPKQLSGGQAQRAAIARGLYTRPRVLLLDEPFSAVDAFTRMKLQDLLLQVAQQHRLTILLVTHDIEEALYLSDRVLLLDGTANPALTEFRPLAQPRQRDAAQAAGVKAAILTRLHC